MIDLPPYDPRDHYWSVADDEALWFSSAARGYVDTDSAPARAFADAGGVPTRIASEDELWAVLAEQAADRLPADQLHRVPVKAWRFHAVLKMQGLADGLERVLASLPPDQQAVARARLEYSDTYDRHDPLVAQLGKAMGMSDAQLDALWQAGHAL